MSIAAAGLRASAARFATDAAKVVKDATIAPSDNLATDLAGTTTDSLAFKANLAVFKLADKTMGTLLDMMA
ncbi:MAG: flagellar hook protein FlgE [Alphaproteobacteria bacterium]|nr:flagellar hook protein FlgE [Alphaproteobacteria bacterium]MDE2111017.1 flagellar hook protein FlgE [Alphaproteobacteria bacterium]MDE2493822.1 flagellar hook protein FlgE [Alphaproteobacteria bacterium]